MISLEEKDLIRLLSGEILEFVGESNNNITGINESGEIVRFRHEYIDCVKKSNIKPCGENNESYWMFYTGPGYKNVTRETVADYARFELSAFKDMDSEEIMHKHLYWGTESAEFKEYYNGDTFILFTNLNTLPEKMRLDAEKSLNI